MFIKHFPGPTKTSKAVYNFMFDPPRYSNDALQHYSWEDRVLFSNDDKLFIKKYCATQYDVEKIKKFLQLLCKSFGVPVPSIRIEPFSTFQGGMTNFLDNEILFMSPSSYHPLLVIHEFCHWYFWHTLRNYYTHNQKFAMKFERRLVWKTRKYWKLLK